MIEQVLASIEKGFAESEKSILLKEDLRLVLLPFGHSYLEEKTAKDLLVYQDLFESNRIFYKSLISSRLGINQTIYARQCKVETVDKLVFNQFCDENHYLKTSNCKVRLGLYHKDQLVMIAGLSKPQLMYRDGEKFYSSMLIRTATLYGFTITGGLSKLLKQYVEQEKPDDIATFIEQDFFDGSGYKKLNFEVYKTQPGHVMWLNIETKLRFSKDQLIKKYKLDHQLFETPNYIPKGYLPIFQQQTLKMVWEIGKSM